MTKAIKLPQASIQNSNMPKTLPFNGKAVSEKSFSFSFACFDRTHELFNLGGNSADDTVSGKWFLELLDCLKNVSNMTAAELKASMHDLHPIDWSKTNTSAPPNSEQCEYWQFRINKSKGRIIGFLIEGVFYIVWLDPHHNLTNSEGYGGIVRYYKPQSLYETQDARIKELEKRNSYLEKENSAYEELLGKQ